MDSLPGYVCIIFFVSIGLLIFNFRVHFFLYADTISKEVPQVDDLMVALCAKALERGWGKGSLETVAAGNPSAFDVGPSTIVDRDRKRRRDASNIATTTRSPGDIRLLRNLLL